MHYIRRSKELGWGKGSKRRKFKLDFFPAFAVIVDFKSQNLILSRLKIISVSLNIIETVVNHRVFTLQFRTLFEVDRTQDWGLATQVRNYLDTISHKATRDPTSKVSDGANPSFLVQ